MTKIFTFPDGNSAIAETAAEAAGYLAEALGGKYNPRRAILSEEPGDEEFEALYGEPQDHPKTATGNPQLLETYGYDLDRVMAIHAEAPNRIWTLVDGDDGISRICAGFHLVNRIAYLTTAKPWSDENETYVWG